MNKNRLGVHVIALMTGAMKKHLEDITDCAALLLSDDTPKEHECMVIEALQRSCNKLTELSRLLEGATHCSEE